MNWLEYFQYPNREDQLKKIRESFEAREYKLKISGKFGILNVGEIIRQIKKEGDRTLSILHEPSKNNESHSGIHGYTFEDRMIADWLADIVEETYPGKMPQ